MNRNLPKVEEVNLIYGRLSSLIRDCRDIRKLIAACPPVGAGFGMKIGYDDGLRVDQSELDRLKTLCLRQKATYEMIGANPCRDVIMIAESAHQGRPVCVGELNAPTYANIAWLVAKIEIDDTTEKCHVFNSTPSWRDLRRRLSRNPFMMSDATRWIANEAESDFSLTELFDRLLKQLGREKKRVLNAISSPVKDSQKSKIGKESESSARVAGAAQPAAQDGPCEPHHFHYGGVDHEITGGQNCRLLRHMWGKVSATVAYLAETVLGVDNVTVRTVVNRLNKNLKQAGYPRRLAIADRGQKVCWKDR